MIVQHFLTWVERAPVSQRVLAANALARVYLQSKISFDERCATEAALTMLLDDCSPKVRLALSEVFCGSALAPLHVVTTLASDQIEVAGPVLEHSPLLLDMDLVDHVAVGGLAIQAIIARRASLSITVTAALAEIAEPEACLVMLYNKGARIAAISYRRLVERLGDHAGIREALLDDDRLPSDCRHGLAVRVGEALQQMDLVAAVIGTKRLERITREACVRASLTLADRTAVPDHPALIEHLRLRGDLTTAFLIRVAAFGRIEFLGSILVCLSGKSEHRVKSLLTSGTESALAALYRNAGLSKLAYRPISIAIDAWRRVARGKLMAGPQEIARMMAEAGQVASTHDASPAHNEMTALLRSIYLDTIRENARNHALDIMAAPRESTSNQLVIDGDIAQQAA